MVLVTRARILLLCGRRERRAPSGDGRRRSL